MHLRKYKCPFRYKYNLSVLAQFKYTYLPFFSLILYYLKVQKT